MSRVGSKPINIPDGMSVDFNNNELLIKNSKSSSSFIVDPNITCKIEDKKLFLLMKVSSKKNKMLWGTLRSNINNLILGLESGFHLQLDITGVGYKADVVNGYLNLSLGFSHLIKYKIPGDIEVKCPKPVQINISGACKQKVYTIASDICRIRQYNPYKGKGIAIKGAYVLRKESNKKK